MIQLKVLIGQLISCRNSCCLAVRQGPGTWSKGAAGTRELLGVLAAVGQGLIAVALCGHQLSSS